MKEDDYSCNLYFDFYGTVVHQIFATNSLKSKIKRNLGSINRNSEYSFCLWEIEILSLGNKSLASVL